jgi:hypothetical protein
MSKTASVKIPAYAYDGDPERSGQRLRLYSLAAAEHLCFTSKAIARRNRRGALVAIQFRNAAGGDPMLRTLRAGQVYSVIERVGEDTRAWLLTGLSGVRADYEIVLSEVSTDGRRSEAPKLAPIYPSIPLVRGGPDVRHRHRNVAHAPGDGAAESQRPGPAAE